MKIFLVLALMALFIGICPNPSSADQADTEEIISLKKQIRTNPNNAEAHNNLGNAYYLLVKYQEAVQEHKEAIRIKPDYADAHNNLGLAYVELGKDQEAIKEYKEAIRIMPDFAEAHYNLGVKYSVLGKDQEAIKEYKELICINPDNAEAYIDLGGAYGKLGKYQEEIREYKKALRINPDDVYVHELLGNTYDMLKDGENAIVHKLIAAKLYEKAGDTAKTARANKSLRTLYAEYGYKPEDFASVKIPDNNKAEGHQAQTVQPTQPPKQGKTQGGSDPRCSIGNGGFIQRRPLCFYQLPRCAWGKTYQG